MNDVYGLPVLCLLTCSALFFVAGPADGLEAGASKIEITPENGVPLDGYLHRMGRGAAGARGSLWVRALYLGDDDTGVLLVSADLYAISPQLRERVLNLAPPDIPNENIILTATHTHNGPGGMSRSWLARQRSGRFMSGHLEKTAKHFETAMHAAYDSRRRGAIGHATTRQSNLTRNRFDVDGPTDTQIGVIRVDDSDGTPIAVIANMAATPATVSRSESLIFSADFPGYFSAALEKRLDAEAVAIFLNGASGDQACANPDMQSGWGWAQSIGEHLANRASSVMNGIECREADIDIHYAAPDWPLSLDPGNRYPTAPLQALSIGRLSMSFLPGTAYAEVGLRLREQARSAGYEAHFTVGLANDYLASFPTHESYAVYDEEFGHTVFGPGVGDWLVKTFQALHDGKGSKKKKSLFPPNESPLGAGKRLTLEGSAHDVGFQQGEASPKEIHAAYERRVLEPLRRGHFDLDMGTWKLLPRIVDSGPLAVVALANRDRPLLAHFTREEIDTISGLAEGAGLAFQAAWLLQTIDGSADGAVIPEPSGTMFAVANGRSGDAGVLVGRNLDWAADEESTLAIVRERSKRGFLSAGFAWNLGVLSGMNDAGLVLCLERANDLGAPDSTGLPAGMHLRRILMAHNNFEEALEALVSVEGLRGYRVLLADRPETDVAVVSFGDRVEVRRAEEGLLLGARIDAAGASVPANQRYARASHLLGGNEGLGVENVRAVLGDYRWGESGPDQILNRFTKQRIIFEPELRRARVAFPDREDRDAAFITVVLERGAR